jgi:hypothetical protein
MSNNPFYALLEEIEEDIEQCSTPSLTEPAYYRPTTPENRVPAPTITPGKKKAKRKINSLMPAITPIKIADPGANRGKTATGFLHAARKALQAALEAEKKALGEEYIVDNGIQLVYNELETILENRPMEIEPTCLGNLELQAQLDQMNAKIDIIAAEIKEKGYKASQPNLAAQRSPREEILPQGKPKTFAEALKGPQAPTTAAQPPKITTFKDRRLILQGTARKGQKIDSLGLRNQINKAFKEKCQILTPVVGTVTISQKGGDIVLTTTEKFDAEFLKGNEAIWKPLFTFTRAIRDTTWSKVVAHMIPTSIFNVEGGMDLLQEEIQAFNGLNPITKPVWLSSPENRAKKMHGSVLLAFESKIEAEKALRNRLQIAGISVRTTEFILARPTDQCHRCQQFGHNERTCKKDPKCPICADNHPKRLHHCHICTSRGEKCIHSKIKCANCLGAHEATDKSCKAYQDTVEKAKKPARGKEPPLQPGFERFSHIQL